MNTFEEAQQHFATIAQKEYIGHKDHVLCLGWSCTGAVVASGSGDNRIHIWNLEEAGTVRAPCFS